MPASRRRRSSSRRDTLAILLIEDTGDDIFEALIDSAEEQAEAGGSAMYSIDTEEVRHGALTTSSGRRRRGLDHQLEGLLKLRQRPAPC